MLTMTVGNVTALLQNNVKRMLAYSSIAHAGYVLVAIVAGGTRRARSAALFYLAVYSFMNLGAFGVLTLLGRGRRGARADRRTSPGSASASPLLGARDDACSCSRSAASRRPPASWARSTCSAPRSTPGHVAARHRRRAEQRGLGLLLPARHGRACTCRSRRASRPQVSWALPARARAGRWRWRSRCGGACRRSGLLEQAQRSVLGLM